MRQNRKWVLRSLLLLLILCNLSVIWLFSSEDGQKSGETSGKVTEAVAEVTVPNYREKPVEEQQEIVSSLHHPLRKAAHMTEFGCLGLLCFLLLSTWRFALWIRLTGAWGFTYLNAVIDEYHQSFSEGRGPQFSDTLIDLSGAVLSVLLFLLICLLAKSVQKRKSAKKEAPRLHEKRERRKSKAKQ